MKKRVSKRSSEEQKGFVWISLRISFLLMILLLILSFLISHVVFNFVFLILLIYSIVLSIIHLFKHKRKAFPITSLVISVLILLFYILGLMAIVNSGA